LDSLLKDIFSMKEVIEKVKSKFIKSEVSLSQDSKKTEYKVCLDHENTFKSLLQCLNDAANAKSERIIQIKPNDSIKTNIMEERKESRNSAPLNISLTESIFVPSADPSQHYDEMDVTKYLERKRNELENSFVPSYSYCKDHVTKHGVKLAVKIENGKVNFVSIPSKFVAREEGEFDKDKYIMSQSQRIQKSQIVNSTLLILLFSLNDPFNWILFSFSVFILRTFECFDFDGFFLVSIGIILIL
jgi:hypothetical protein